jgi:hypothetical protein
VIRDRRRREEAGELEPAVAVRRAHHGNLDALIARSSDTSGPFSIVARPSSSRPRSRKKSIVPPRSSTTIPTLSIRLSAMRPIYNVSSSLTTDPFAAPRHERVATEKSLPNNTYSGRITGNPDRILLCLRSGFHPTRRKPCFSVLNARAETVDSRCAPVSCWTCIYNLVGLIQRLTNAMPTLAVFARQSMKNRRLLIDIVNPHFTTATSINDVASTAIANVTAQVP